MMKNEYNKYIICLVVIAIFCIMIFKTELYSRYFFDVMTKEFIPGLDDTDSEEKKIIYEFMPVYGANVNFEEYEDTSDYDFSQDNNLYMADENSVSTLEAVDITTTELTTEENVTTEEVSTEATTEEVALTINPVSTAVVYEREKLLDYNFLLSNIYNVATSTSITPDELDGEVLLDMDLSLDLSGDDYKVLIYHTHGSEAFIDSRPGVVEDTIIGVGTELTKILTEDYGIKTYHDTTAYDMMEGSLNRSRAYTYSGEGVDAILAKYPTIEVIIDVHRDGVDESIHLVRVIDGRPTAQIMLLNGVSRSNSTGDIDYLYNEYKQQNLAFSLKMQLAGKARYGDLMRRIYVASYCYNLNKKPRASLVEVGAQTNTVEEAKNAMIPLAYIINSVLTEGQ